MSDIAAILGFWFQPAHEEKWFVVDPAFDAAVRGRLLAHHLEAAGGGYLSWKERPEGCLALCILLDQVPRNLYRGTVRAFASDAQALAVTRHAIVQGFDKALPQKKRVFLYLPLQHSEDLTDQDDCCLVMAGMDEDPGWYDYALRHRDIVARFGRFPHRNEALGRASSKQEEEFLTEPGSSF
jgi:uncharacterized protein (DUF924 family)